MRFQDLSPADQKLLRTDFGRFDKVAQEHVEQAAECYNYGFDKLASEHADAIDAMMAEKTASDHDEVQLDEDAEKVAAELGAITERGYSDGLAKLGSERHGDELHYFWPLIEEKIAQEGAVDALQKFASKMGKIDAMLASARDRASSAGKYVGDHVGKKKMTEHYTKAMNSKLTNKKRLEHAAKGVGKATGMAAGAGAASYGAYRGGKALFGKKKEE